MMIFRLALSLLLLQAPLLLAAPASDPSEAALISSKTRVWFHQKTGTLAGIEATRGLNLVCGAEKAPLWTLEVVAAAGAKPQVLTADMAKNVAVESSGEKLRLTYLLDLATVIVDARLAADAALIHWSLDVEMKKGGLWSATFPRIAIAAFDGEPGANEMVVPYRRGQVRPFGKAAPKGDTDLPYPGPSAKYQFVAVYGRTSGHGFYYAVEDGDGNAKSLQQGNHPATDCVILASQHFPAGRGTGVQHFHLPYDVVTGPYTGDWWHAARLYREWWVKQVWATKGLLADREDLPPWLLHAPLAVRPSTTKAARTVANNLACINTVSEALGGAPIIGTWYGYPQGPESSKGLDENGLGHLWPAKPGLINAVHEVADKDVHLQAYVQSMIYDGSVPSQDGAEARQAVTLSQAGKQVPYGSGESPNLLAMCRATDWWQRRIVTLSEQAVRDFGFSGVYLDSFGKGAPECFAADHGHPIGGGNTFIDGQRSMAKQVRNAIKDINPQAIMSGEDPVEAFRDLLDVNLYSVNAMKDYVPVTRAIWGDYSLGHGRVLGPGKANNCLVPEMGLLFIEGTIPGRLYCDSPEPFLLQPAYAKEFTFFGKLAGYTEHGLAWLRFGEALHPLDLKLTAAPVPFTESCEGRQIELPAVLNSVSRSHADGSVAFVLVNISAANQTVSVPVDPTLCLTNKQPELLRMDPAGTLAPLASDGRNRALALTLEPMEVAFLVLK